MRIAICPGSFDPVTHGHLNIIERTSGLFDKVVVLVLGNPNKNPMFTEDERVEFLRRVTPHLPNVEVDSYNGLLADYAAKRGACTLIKGLRAVTDFEYEFQQALTNKKLNPQLETMFMITDAHYMYLSSSIAKQVAAYGGDVTEFIPDAIRADVIARIRENKKLTARSDFTNEH
ncbi:MAG: pantetheine-phosphate adenylyltransferase [Ruthenibacterium sp.]